MKSIRCTIASTGLLLSLLPLTAMAGGDAVDLFVDLRPGNPCQQFSTLQAAIDQAGLEAGDVQKVIHLVGGATFTGEFFRIRDLRNLKIIADVADTADTCTILPLTSSPAPAKFDGTGLTTRTLEIDAIADTGTPGNVAIENVEFLNNVNQGAVSVADSTLTLRNVTFRGNTARVDSALEGGGAIAVIENDRQAFLRLLGNVKFLGNRATVAEGSGMTAAYGGAVSCTGGAVITAPPLPTGEAASFGDGTEEGANEAEGFGGAIGAIDCGIDLDDTSFNHNIARDGGGAMFLYERRDLRVFIDASQFLGNRQSQAAGGGGGALAIFGESRRAEGTVEIGSSTFAGNEAAGFAGGALLMQVVTGSEDDSHPTSLRIADSTFLENLATGVDGEGGAVYLNSGGGPPPSIQVACEEGSLGLPQDRYCMEFIGNAATKDGAAIRIEGDYKDGSTLDKVALRDNRLTSPASDAGSALSISVGDRGAFFFLLQTLVEGSDDPADVSALLAFNGTENRGSASLSIQRSTLRHQGRILDFNQSVGVFNSLMISPDLSGLPAPGEDFGCSLAVESENFPGLNLRTTSRGELRPSETSILRLHSEALFQPCSDQVRNTHPIVEVDLDGLPRPEIPDDADAYDIGAFEFSTPNDTIFSYGFEPVTEN